MHIFEPVPQFVQALSRRFADDGRVQIHPFAVGVSDREALFRVAADGTGAFAEGKDQIVEFIVAERLSGLVPTQVDLAAINVEGGEYELIEALAATGRLQDMRHILVQFHTKPNRAIAEQRREASRAALRLSHNLCWTYDFVWEYWQRR